MQGESLGPYRIDRELGSGGMGTVYLAAKDDAQVAVKVVHPHLLDAPGFFKRFLREAEIGRGVQHPNVVRTLDCDALSGCHYLVMEYVEGQTLRQLLDEMTTVPEDLCRHIGLEIAKGVAAIHAAGVIHRDLKPENILITADHVVKVMDLGVARLVDEALRLSQTGAFVGSLQYAAPEQFERDARVDGRADLHALGLVLYELASGQNPYLADDVPQTLRKVLNEQPRRLGEILPQLSPFFEELVHTLLAKKREARFASAGDLCTVLEEGEASAWWQEREQTIRAVTRRPLRRVRVPRETAVYGRAEELGRLRSLYDRSSAGDGQVVLIQGEAGIGKSRLVDELIGRLHAEGEDVNFLFGSYPPGGAATASGAFSTAYREQIGTGGAGAYLEETPLLAPAFEALLAGDATPEGSDWLTKDSLQTCFVTVTRALAAERPTVVLIDDLHFAPEEGRALFTALAMAAPGHRVLLIGTLRPGVSLDWVSALTRMEQVTPLSLDRLGPKDLVLLLEDCLHSEYLAMELAGQIGLKSDGNPFFVFEIIRSLREERRLTRGDDGTWRTTGQLREIQIPSSVRDLVGARVAELAEGERDVLEVASCCGYEFDPSLVARALDEPLLPTLKRFARIEQKHQLIHAAGHHYRFDHHQVQEALYDHLFVQLRQEYHAALGRALEAGAAHSEGAPHGRTGAEAVELCEHFLEGNLPARALEYLDDGLRHLEEGYLHDAVVRLASRALDAPDLVTGEQRRVLLLRKAYSLDQVGSRRDEQRAALDEAVGIAEEAADPRSLAETLTRLGQLLESLSRSDEGSAVLTRALALAREAGDGRAEANAARSLGHLYRHRGRMEGAHQLYERGMEIALELGDRQGEAFAAGSLGLIMNHLGRYEEALEFYRRDLAILRELGNRRAEAKALGNMGNTLEHLGRFDEARECQERCFALARETGDRKAEAIALFSLGGLIQGQGQPEEARVMYERCRDLAREIDFRLALATVPGSLGLLYFGLGRLAESLAEHNEHLRRSRELDNPKGMAVSLLNVGTLLGLLGAGPPALEHCLEAVGVSRDLGERRVLGHAHRATADVLENQGDLAGAAEHYEQALTIWREIRYPSGVTPALTGRGRLALREGRSEEARSLFGEALALAGEHDDAVGRVLCSCYLALLPKGDRPAAEAAWAEHGAKLDPLPRLEARFRLWQVTGEASHLTAAHELLTRLIDHAPDAYRETMIRNVPLHRDVRDAFAARNAAPPADA